MMITFVSRGTGLFVPFYLSACLWIVGIWYPERTFHDASYTAWGFLWATIIAAVHAFVLFRNSRRVQGHGSRQPETIWDNSFLFLPVFVWALVFMGISLWSFFGR